MTQPITPTDRKGLVDMAANVISDRFIYRLPKQLADAVLTLDAALTACEQERDRLKMRLLSAAGDDLCRLSQDEIKELSAGQVQIPPREEFIASCERFHAQLVAGPGVLNKCLTLAQLIAENQKLESLLTTEREKTAGVARQYAELVENHKTCKDALTAANYLLRAIYGTYFLT